MRFQQTADSTISYLRSFSSLNRRKTTAILLCLILVLGHIPTNAAALSDQVLDSVVGSGLGESEVKTSNMESDAKAAATEEVSGNETLTNDSHEAEESDSEYSNVESTGKYIEVATESGIQASLEEPAITDKVQQEENINQTDEAETPIPLKEPILTDEMLLEEQKEQSEQSVDEMGQEITKEEKTPVAEGVVLQSTTYTCGPAALATLLKMLGSDNNYYEMITQLVQVDQNGSSLLELKHSVEALGYSAAGYRKSIEELAFSGPVLAHVVINDYHHFTVVEGMADGYVFLADPTLGRVSISLEQFKKVWNGIALEVSKKSPVEIMPIDPKGERISETDEYQQTNSGKNKFIETVPLAEVAVISSTDESSSESGIAVETPIMLDENDITTHEITDVCRELLEKTKNPTIRVQSAEMLTFTEASGIQNEQAEACILSLKTDTILCLNYEKTVPEKQNESSNGKKNFNEEQKSELPEEALVHEIDTLSVEGSEKYATKRLIQSSQLDETEMTSIRGRAIFLVPLAIKAVKLAPAVTSGVQILKKTTMANARSIGIAGERAVGITGRKMQIKMPNGKIRVPDSVNFERHVLTEVKNVRSLNFTSQLRDYSSFAQREGLRFELHVRSNTKLSRPLQNAINQGTIIRRNIPRI